MLRRKVLHATLLCMKHFSISATVKEYPKLPYEKIKDAVLGNNFDVSLVFVGEKRAQQLNQDSRGKTYVPNVLSFPLTDKSGEIYITPKTAKKEAKAFELSERGYIGYLFIHGLLHLKGLDHGSKMEKLEQKYMKQFKLT